MSKIRKANIRKTFNEDSSFGTARQTTRPFAPNFIKANFLDCIHE
jgi:hypothetical protein